MNHRPFSVLCLLLSLCICLSACVHTDAQAPANEETSPSMLTREEWEDASSMTMGCSLGFAGHEDGYLYEGGELHTQLLYRCRGYRDIGLGLLLFLDGQPQPFRTAEETEYSYMHKIYPEDNLEEYSQLDVWLTPVTGEAGDTLELQVVCVSWPDYFIDQGMLTNQHTRGTTGSARTVRFEAGAPAQTLPQVQDRVVSWTLTREDIEEKEKGNWSEIEMKRHSPEIEYSLKYNEYNYCTDGGVLYSFVPGDYVTFRYESIANTDGEFGLVIFVDNEPVSVAAEDLIFYRNEDWKKTVIEVKLDLSDFDGSSVIYAFTLGRNYFQEGARETFFETRNPYYLSGAQSLEDLMNWK